MGSVTKTLIVNAPLAQVFGFWRNFENFPRFMENIESIEVTGAERSHWKARGPLGKVIEWDAVTTSVLDNRKIAWQSVGGEIETHGAVVFEAVDQARTRVTVGLEYALPGGVLGEAVAKMFSDPEQQLDDDLQRFKVASEAGPA